MHSVYTLSMYSCLKYVYKHFVHIDIDNGTFNSWFCVFPPDSLVTNRTTNVSAKTAIFSARNDELIQNIY